MEVIVRADFDDFETIEFLKPLSYEFDFKPIFGDRPASLCHSFNEMAKLGVGKYHFVLTDDAEIMTQDWDEIALGEIEEKGFKDDILYGYTSDTSIDKTVGKKYASFPIISKRAIDILGMFMYEQFVGFGGDSSIYRVYEGINRIIDMGEIEIDHINNNSIFKVMSPDLTGHEMRQRTQLNLIDPFSFDISNEVNKLKTHLNE